ncbi:MAG: hypothetical protein HRU75_11470 [Planctomycetia bacterium]|nr:MAG: hypothetical protein HRU75_11470 [Planctomycetia bacterium]
MNARRRPRRTKAWRGSKPPPGVRNLLAWLLPFAAISTLTDWMVAAQVFEHYERHGHVWFPGVGTAFALSVSVTTIAIPFLWLQARKAAKSRR